MCLLLLNSSLLVLTLGAASKVNMVNERLTIISLQKKFVFVVQLGSCRLVNRTDAYRRL